MFAGFFLLFVLVADVIFASDFTSPFSLGSSISKSPFRVVIPVSFPVPPSLRLRFLIVPDRDTLQSDRKVLNHLGLSRRPPRTPVQQVVDPVAGLEEVVDNSHEGEYQQTEDPHLDDRDPVGPEAVCE